MSSPSPPKDLVILVPDTQVAAAVEGICRRPEALGIRRIAIEVPIHWWRDSGCFRHAPEFLGRTQAHYSAAMVVFDHHGCGSETEAKELERDLEARLVASGWLRVAAVCIDPELEAWVWGNSPHVTSALGWKGDLTSLRAWLRERGLWPDGMAKPPDPRTAFERALRQAGKPRSSAIFADLASTVSLRRCSDRSFVKLRETLRAWFGDPETPAACHEATGDAPDDG